MGGPAPEGPGGLGTCRSACVVLSGSRKAAVRILEGIAQLPGPRNSRGVCGAGPREPSCPFLARAAQPCTCQTGVRWLKGPEATSAGPGGTGSWG